MKKWIILAITILVLGGIASGLYYYKYNYKDTVTAYYLIKYTPPIDEYDKPEIKIEKLQNYANDTMAINDQKKKEEGRVETLLKEAESDLSKPEVKGNELKYNAYLNVYEKLISEKRTLLRFTTIRKFEDKKFLNEFIEKTKKYGILSKETTSLKEKYKLDMATYPIN